MLAALISSNTEEVYGKWDAEPVTEPPSPFTDIPADQHKNHLYNPQKGIL
jgi:TatD DNase family protein